MMMPRGTRPFALLLSCLVGGTLCGSASGSSPCLKAFMAGPWAAVDVPVFPRALSRVSQSHHATVQNRGLVLCPEPVFTGVHMMMSLASQGALHAHDVYAQPLSLPEVVLQRSRTDWGDTVRSRSLFHKLHQGMQRTACSLIVWVRLSFRL